MKTIKEVPRKILRYLMFAKQNGIELKKPILGKKKDSEVIKYFEKKKEFTSWEDFEKKWDIGIGEDIIAQANRQEKWFLFGKEKTDIVKRPEDYWEKESERRGITSHALYMLECNQRNINIEEFFKMFF